ncbi:MAG: hypothetical protein KatS3mg108_3560 [Isosphaeraceae bacterium]|jgi:hypothetical protein|nr:MAG: hypothetical protein KatS3mg108_3560 [Isosphaeraceae bacterium]
MPPLKCLMVYRAGNQWFGSEVEWARSGSGWYRQTVGVPIPQTVSEIERFAAENGYRIEWQDDPSAGQATAEDAAGTSPVPEAETGTSVSTW